MYGVLLLYVPAPFPALWGDMISAGPSDADKYGELGDVRGVAGGVCL